jgi:protocatechuate 3,4-dioxygenase beta subunit
MCLPLVLAACTAPALNREATTSAPAQPTSAPPTPPPPAQFESTPATATDAPTTASVQAQLPPTPSCGDDDEPTPAQTEGPYYTPNSPERTSLLEPGLTGTHLVVSGYALTTDCQPVARALVDFWHCDDGGVYDNAGYRLRGHQFTDDQGHYSLETIMPGLYPGRTRHIHVKVQAPSQPVLTTQMYFPGEPDNDTDGIYNPALLMNVQDAESGKLATFNFVLSLG